MTHRKTALILGATGGIGTNIAAALDRRAWHVRGMSRAAPTEHAICEWMEGDAMDRAAVMAAARGADAIFHCVLPRGYRGWDSVVLPMIDNSIAAVAATGARLLVPGNVYNFDPRTNPVIRDGAPQDARTRKGRIRIAMEQRLRDAAPDVPVVILRAGDFFGPGARQSWFNQVMVKPGRPVHHITAPSRAPGHSWAYLPDLGETFARLLEVEDRLAPFEDLSFAGHFDATGHRMTDAIRRAVGRDVPIRAFPWWLLRLAAPVARFPREVVEMADGWHYPVRLDDARLAGLIGPPPETDLDTAVRAALASLDCLDTDHGLAA